MFSVGLPFWVDLYFYKFINQRRGDRWSTMGKFILNDKIITIIYNKK